MYANLGTGRAMPLDGPSRGRPDLLYNHAYVARRTQEQRNLYAYVITNPVNLADPSGMKLVDTGVKQCAGYIKGDLIWGNLSAHSFVVVDGVGHGRYEEHNSVWGTSVINDRDLDIYPERDPANLKPGEQYSVCQPVQLDDSLYDIQTYGRCVRQRIEAERVNSGSYLAGFRDCDAFVFDVIGSCQGPAFNRPQCPVPDPPRPPGATRPVY